MSIPKKIILVVIVVSTVLAIAMSAISYFFTVTLLEEKASGQQYILSQKIMGSVDFYISERLNDIITMSEDEQFEDSLLNETGDNSEEVAGTNKKLREVMKSTGPWDKLSLANEEGVIVFSTREQELGENIISNTFPSSVFGQLTEGRPHYYSDVFIDQYTGFPTMMITAPIRDESSPDEPVIGVVVGYLSWADFLKVLRDEHLPKEHTVELFNSNGFELGDNEFAHFNEILNFNARSHPAISQALIGESGVGRFNIDLAGNQTDSPLLISYVSQSGRDAYQGNGWVLVVSASEDVILEGIGELVLIPVVLLLLATYVAAFFIFIFLKKVISDPIVNLHDVSAELAEGNLEARAEIKTSDEIGQLGEALNVMGKKLHGMYSKMEEKVNERTKELQESTSQNEAILSNIGDGLVVTDTERRIVLANKRVEELLGWKEDEMLGKVWEEVVPVVDEEGSPSREHQELLGKLLTSSDTAISTDVAHPLFYVRKDGTNFPAAATLSKVTNDGVLSGVIVVFRDISKDREIDRAKTEFVSLASHQLRTPLSTINWYTEMLLSGDGGEINRDQKKYLEEIYQGSQRMVELVNALLNVSRLELGTFAIEPEETDLVKLARSVMDEQKPHLDERKQTLTPELDKTIPKVLVDQKLIRMVMQNLLSNAIKYTPVGGAIGFAVTRDESGENVAIKVSDNGYGIPEDQKDDVFSKLFRADNVKEKDTVGTGLGLYIVKSVVEHSGGSIEFESKEDEGTTFYVKLPLSGMKEKKGEKELS